MKRLLCLTAGMNAGGAETFLMKVYRRIDRSKYQMDFCVTVPDNYYAEEIESLGGKIFLVPPKSRNPIANFNEIRKIVKENGYDCAVRVCENSLAVLDLLAAKAGGAGRLVMRSSNANSAGTVVRILHRLFSFLPKWVPDVKLAPSTMAAEYTFGKGSVARGEAVLLKNGLDVSYFRFDAQIRRNKRAELEVEDRLVVGHVGRFSDQKNHSFLMDVFYEIYQQRSDAVLLLAGKGENQEMIRRKAEELGISDAVHFLGVRSDVNHLLMAMDVFVFPSLYEGMPNTVIEAQATGLPCVIADTITPEADITGLVRYLPLESPETWAEEALRKGTAPRMDTSEMLIENGYDIDSVAREFVRLIFGEALGNAIRK